MNIYLKNYEIENLHACLKGISQRSGVRDGQIVGVNGLTQYKLNKLLSDIESEAKDWLENKKMLADKYVKGGAEKPETENGQFVFNDGEAKKEYIDVAESYSPVNVRTLLTEKDLEQLQITAPEMQFIMLIVEGDARTQKPKENG